ncbi:protein SGT1 homolog isoform X2 [Anabrus simplex]
MAAPSEETNTPMDSAGAGEAQASSPKIKYDWYQTETSVVITILAKNIDKDGVKVDFREKMLSLTAKLPSGSDYSLELDLAHPVVPAQCSYKVLPSKIEVKLKKCDDIRWQMLEGDPEAPDVPQPIPQAFLNSGPPKYPSSASKPKDWDRVVGELAKEDDDKAEGEAALNSLFQKIYSQGSDEVKRAMNKSFQESGGTVLSTNWNEVSKDKVDVKPPDGMEWKKWDS